MGLQTCQTRPGTRGPRRLHYPLPPVAGRPTGGPPPPPANRAPSSPFKLVEELGRVLLGGTFKAVDTRNDLPVIVKFLRKELLEDRAVVERFLAEAKVAKTIDHPT